MAQKIDPFEIPDWAKGQSTNEIHAVMLGNLPDDMDKSEGGVPWDFTRPVAIEKSQMVQFILMETIKNMFPQWAKGAFLDYHAENRGITRKAATFATVTVTVTGIAGTPIPKGFKFSTLSTLNSSAVEYETLAETAIEGAGVGLPCKAVKGGTVGNVTAGSIKTQVTPISGIMSVTNNQAASGGIEAESDDALRQRILEYDRNQDVSFAGTDADYKRWAESIEGVMHASVIPPADDTGIITIYITTNSEVTDVNAKCQEVYDYIMGTADPSRRLSPVNAQISVVSSTTVPITVSADITLQEGYDQASVKSKFLTSLQSYLASCTDEVKYAKTGSLLMDTEGISDYSGLKVNNGTVNITLANGQIPATDATKVVLT